MKILWFSTRFPYPPKGGDVLLTYKHLEGLSKWAETYLFSLDEFGNADEYSIRNLKKETHIVSVKVIKNSKKIRIFRSVKTILSSKIPAQCYYYHSKYALKCFEKYVNEIKPDLVIFQTVRSYFYFKSIFNMPKILYFVDAISHNYTVALPYVDLKTKMIYKNEIPKLLKIERELIEECNSGIFVSKRDIKWLKDKGINSAKLKVIPNGTDVNYFSYKEPNLRSKKLVFFGNMRTVANHDVATYLINDIFPHIREEYSDSELWIVGANPRKELIALNGKNGIHVTGSVDDIRPYIWNARIAVSPIRIGAGMQNKIVEAAALGTPQVISKLAYDGINSFKNGEDLLVAADKNEFVNMILSLMENDELALSLSRKARKTVEQSYTWEESWRKLRKHIEEINLS